MVLKKLALRIAARRPSPDPIPRSGERAAKVNSYTTYMHAEDDSWSMLVDSVSYKGVTGRLLEDNEYKTPFTMLWSSLSDVHFQFRRYIGPYDFEYHTVGGFLRAELLALPRAWVYRNQIEQFFFNRRRLARVERIELLRVVIGNTLKDRNYRVTPHALLADLHTRRSYFHPDRDQELAYLRLLLESFLDSKELRQENGAYSVGPRALATLAQHEEEERRHRDSVRHQLLLAAFTFSLVIVGVAQIVVAYLRG